MSLSTATGLRSRLRAATGEAHERLDQRVSAAGFFDDRTSYAAYLDATWRARQPVEDGLDSFGIEALYPVWPARRIAAALAADIADLGGPAPRLDRSANAFTVATTAQALGVLYVLEGSALGARLLARRAAAIGMTPVSGARHLRQQTSFPKAWGAMLALLDTAALDDDGLAECEAAALATFQCFDAAYAGNVISAITG